MIFNTSPNSETKTIDGVYQTFEQYQQKYDLKCRIFEY